MNIKALLNLTIAILMVVFISCDDDLTEVGNSIQPGGDDISIYIDTVQITARTVSLEDSVYARTQWGLLGNYTDSYFGSVKSDYLAELYCPENTKFPDKTFSIDSTFIEILSESFLGDTISPFGIAAYRVTTPLTANFFTNANPKKYCDMTEPLGQGIFSIADAPNDSGLRSYFLRLKNSVGQEFYDEWENSKGATFKNSETLKKFFKGMYVTNSFGTGSLLSINATQLKIYFKYTGRNVADTADSTRVGLFRLTFTPEVIQLNHVQNKNPEYLFTNSDTRTYLKSPAGVCTEITIPLGEIMKKASETGKKNNKLNAANFKIKGYSEVEEESSLGRSSTLLFINKDSLNNFFLKKKMADAKTSFIMERSAATNTYNFVYANVSGSTSNNIANLVNYYMDYYKDEDKANIPDLKYMVIPISASTQSSTSTYGSSYNTYVNVYNQMNPTSAVLRTDKDNMKMALIFSNYNSSAE
ncbi:DUF4270 domain-containing protein [Dysgonomonas sp. 521]|uniref:DUF4270 domain-containing protein n=1 Tax=Dysgonomonas sp. 521 TaxID=2302932 RepID=UPI0013D53B5B|nr:DUF4270 domain-containing protein [Dysgonomonas sp. 521]NDV94463.1 DUF4270 domain-containing protein [Dysgonomonas sp. 521]